MGHCEIQPGADQRRQSEYESSANRKSNVDKPVFVPGWRALGADLAVIGCAVAIWNYNGFPVRATLHGDYSDAKLICRNNPKVSHLFRTLGGHRQSLMQQGRI